MSNIGKLVNGVLINPPSVIFKDGFKISNPKLVDLYPEYKLIIDEYSDESIELDETIELENGIKNYEISYREDGENIYRIHTLVDNILEPKTIYNYDEMVENFIREVYTISEELAILRQREVKKDEFEEYFNFCEECKLKAQEIINNNT